MSKIIPANDHNILIHSLHDHMKFEQKPLNIFIEPGCLVQRLKGQLQLLSLKHIQSHRNRKIRAWIIMRQINESTREQKAWGNYKCFLKGTNLTGVLKDSWIFSFKDRGWGWGELGGIQAEQSGSQEKSWKQEWEVCWIVWSVTEGQHSLEDMMTTANQKIDLTPIRRNEDSSSLSGPSKCFWGPNLGRESLQHGHWISWPLNVKVWAKISVPFQGWNNVWAFKKNHVEVN